MLTIAEMVSRVSQLADRELAHAVLAELGYRTPKEPLCIRKCVTDDYYEDSYFCPTCDEELDEGVEFCPACGQQLDIG